MGKKVVFIMPYGRKAVPTGKEGEFKWVDFDKVFKKYKNTLSKNKDLSIHRVDHSFGTDIKKKMWGMIKHADIIIADLASYNPNVMYELGARHVFKKKITIMVNDYINNIPFDINDFSIIKSNELSKTVAQAIKRKLNDSPIKKSSMKKKEAFEDFESDTKKFIKKASEIKKKGDWQELEEHCDKNEWLQGNEMFDSFKSLALYKNGKYKEAKELLENHYPLFIYDYEITGLYASVTRLIFEKNPSKINMLLAEKVAMKMYSNFPDAYGLSSLYMFKLAMAEKGEITYEDLLYEFGQLSRRVSSIKNSKDEYLNDAIKTIKYAAEDKEKIVKFDHPASSEPVIRRIDKLRKGR